MQFINQPREGNLGEKLQEILSSRSSNGFGFFYIMVAYVKKSGVEELKPYLEQFRRDGGLIKATVGIDKNTSFQGLELLLPLCDEIYVYHNDRPDYTFHPKIYFFEKEGEMAVAFVGSNNLTFGGLYTNYEVAVLHEFDLTKQEDANEFQKIKSIFSSYSNLSNSCCKRLTSDFLQQLRDDYLSDEEQERREQSSQSSSSRSSRSRFFGTETFEAPPRPRRPRVTGRPAVPTLTPTISDQPTTKGRLVWRKNNLPPSDVQHSYRENTNPTGGLRLTQAGWEVDGHRIDQTTYFRNLFRNFNWVEERSSPFVEVAEVLFNVEILGRNEGQHRLTIRHKPSGEAGQGNYTTILSWGELGDLIESSNLAGKDFLLYAPPEGRREPFYIEIR